MKFKALISEQGKILLERQFLPCLERHGKSCYMLISPADLYLLQTTEEADGLHVSLRFSLDEIFEVGSCKVQSRHHNLVAFKLELAHLKGSLKAASNSLADSVEMKLSVKSTPTNADGTEHQAKPFLCITSKGPNTNMTHEIPIGRPLTPNETDELSKDRDVEQLCPYYLDIQGEQQRLQALVDKLKSIDGSMTLVTTKQGFLYLQVSAPGIQLASEVQNLEVVPHDALHPDPADKVSRPCRGTAPQARLQAAMSEGLGQLVVVQVKQFARSLHSSQVALPAKLLLGIAENAGHVHFMFAFRDTRGEDSYNDNIILSFMLPVRNEE